MSPGLFRCSLFALCRQIVPIFWHIVNENRSTCFDRCFEQSCPALLPCGFHLVQLHQFGNAAALRGVFD